MDEADHVIWALLKTSMAVPPYAACKPAPQRCSRRFHWYVNLVEQIVNADILKWNRNEQAIVLKKAFLLKKNALPN